MRFSGPAYLWLAAFCLLSGQLLAANEPALPTVVIREIPAGDDDLAQAHASSEHLCLEIPAGYGLAQPQFDQRIGYRLPADESRKGEQVAWFDAARRNVVSLGMRMSPEDQQNLPLLTGPAILDRVQSQYLVVQVRVQRAGPDGMAFLHYRPMAAACAYGNTDRTLALAKLTQTAVRDVRSLGMFVPAGQPVTAETLRTLVVVYRSNHVVADDDSPTPRVATRYELLLVRARPLDASAGNSEDVQLHAFGTSDNRRRLHYLLPYRIPARLDDCGIQSTIYFTDYALGNLFPTARAARQVAIRDTASYELDQLEQFAAAQGWGATAWERIDLVLDAIIDQRVEFDETP